MIKKLNARERFEWTSSLLLALFCIRPGLAALPLLLLLIQLIINIRKKEVHFQTSATFWGFALLFLAYTVAIIATESSQAIGNELVGKISLLVFPLVFAFRFSEPFSLRPIAIGLIFGTMVAFALSTIHSVQIYQQTHDFNNSFGSSSFSYIHHPSYLAAFFTLTWLLVLQGFKEKWTYFNLLNFAIYTVFFLATLLFCFSFAAILFFFLICAVLVIKALKKRLPSYLFWVSLIVLPVIPIVAYHANIHIKIEIDRAFSSVKSFANDPTHIYEKAGNDPSGNNIRLLMWTVTCHEIAQQPFGYGTAGRTRETVRELREHHLNEIAEKKYNPHNQFFQTAVETGIQGLLIFLATLILFIREGIRNKNVFLIWIVANLVFNSLFESMLQRESGIVFYIFLLCYTYLSSSDFTNIPDVKSKKIKLKTA